MREVLVDFAGWGLTAQQVAAEAEASASYARRALVELERQGFAEVSTRNPQGIDAGVKHYLAKRGAVAAEFETAREAEVREASARADAVDWDAEWAEWAAWSGG